MAFQRFISGRAAQPGDEAALDAIWARGWIVDGPCGVRALSPETLPLPSREIAPQASLASVTDRIKAVASIQKARFDLARLPLHTLFDRMARSTAALGEDRTADGNSIDRIAAAFATLGMIIRRQDQCLPLSIAFKRLSLASRARAALVIGVKLDPFVAHCWVQRDDCVVNDTIERVRLFTPMLAI